MSNTSFPIEQVNGAPLTDEQRQYLTGFFAGIAARGFAFTDADAAQKPAHWMS